MKISVTQSALVIRMTLAVIGSIAGAAFGANLFLEELKRPAGLGQGAQAASLDRAFGTIKRKRAARYVWNLASEGEHFFVRESLETGDQSWALLGLPQTGGNDLEIQENSLIIFDPSEELGIRLLDGSVILHQGAKSYLLAFEKSAATPTLRELPGRLLEPKYGQELFVPFGSDRDLTLKWRVPPNPHDSVILQLTRHPSESIKSVEVKSDSLFPVRLPRGGYEWRLTQQSIPLTGTGRFIISAVLPLRPIYPEPGTHLNVVSKERSAVFRWVGDTPKGAWIADPIKGLHSLEVSTSRNFDPGTLVAQRRVDPAYGSATLDRLGPGKFFWRIQSRYGDLQIPTEVRELQLDKSESAKISLARPAARENFRSNDTILFEWDSDAGESDFNVEVEWVSDGSKASAVQTREFRWLWTNPKPGKYRWRVIASEEGRPVGESTWREFYVDIGNFEGPSIQALNTTASPTPKARSSKEDSGTIGLNGTEAASSEQGPKRKIATAGSAAAPTELTASWANATDAIFKWKLQSAPESKEIIIEAASADSIETPPSPESFSIVARTDGTALTAQSTLNRTPEDSDRDRWIRVKSTAADGSTSIYSEPVLLVAYSSSLLSYPEVVLADHPLGYWRLGERSGTSARDASGHALDGTFTNSPSFGVPGAISLDSDGAIGTSNSPARYVSVNSNALDLSTKSGKVSLEIWFAQTSAAAGWEGVFGKATSTSLDDGYGLYIDFRNGAICFYINHWWHHHLCSSRPLPIDGTFSHVVGTYDGNLIALYVNGALDISWPAGLIPYSSGAELRIGNVGNYGFDGVLDEAAIYDSPLSSQQIQNHFQARSRRPCRAISGRVCPK